MTEVGENINNIKTKPVVISPKEAFIRSEYRKYTNVLEEYSNHGDGSWEERLKQSPRAGWKFHLNVKPENVINVSEFLKNSNFHHKYLSGGEIDSGKIFTVYTGSKQITEKSVKEIWDNIGKLLEKPKAQGEAAFAPNIVGRFEGDDNYFRNKRCKNGISIHKARDSWGLAISDEDLEYSKNMMTRIYGDYFGGGIDFYFPKVLPKKSEEIQTSNK